MALPVTITGLSTAVATVGPFQTGTAQVTIVSTDVSGGNLASFGATTGNLKAGQTWTTDTPITPLRSFTFRVVKSGSPTDNLVCDIYAVDGSGLPTGTSLAQTAPVAAASIVAGANTTFTLGSLLTLSPFTKYAAVLSRTGSLDAVNFYQIAGTNINAYGQGTPITQNASSVWSTLTTVDAYFITGTDGYFLFGRDSTTATLLQCFKSYDPSTSWFANVSKSGFTTAILNIAGYQAGNTIHLLVQDGTMSSSVATKYLSYDTVTDSFLATTETVSAAQVLTGQATSGWGCSLVVRSNGEVVAFYNGLQTKTTTLRARVYYRRRTGVNTYGTETMVDAALQVDNLYPIVALGASDRVHFLWFNGTNTLQRHLTSANALGTVASTGATTAPLDCCTFNDAGTIRHVGFTSATAFRWASADNPTVTAVSVTFGTPTRTVDDGTDVYALYQNSADSDLYTKKSTDRGATFGAGTDVFTATVAAADANVSKNQLAYQRGSSFVFPYVANDNGTLKYNESVVRSLVVDHPLPATAGSYGLTGAATTNVLRARIISATTPASYALTGTAAFPRKTTPVVAGLGSYSLAGAATTALVRQRSIFAAAPIVNYALTGAATTNALHKWKMVATTPSSYALTGTVAGFPRAYKPVALAGSYSLIGAASTNVLHRWTVAVGTASYALTGVDATLVKRANKILAAAAASYAVTGTSASLLHNGTVAAAGGSYALLGTAAGLNRVTDRVLQAPSGSYSLAGSAAGVLFGRKLAATAGSYALTGTAASIVHDTGELAPPIFGGGGIARPPRPYPVEGIGYGILPPLEGEAFGDVIIAGIGEGHLPRLLGQATGSIGAAGSSAAQFAIKAAASGVRGQVGTAIAQLNIAATSSGRASVCGKGFGMIKFEGAAIGKYDDDEAAAVTFLLAA